MSCPVASFRFNTSAAVAWAEHEWSNAQTTSEDIGTIVIGVALLCASALVLFKGDLLVKPVFFLSGAVMVGVPSFAAVSALLDSTSTISPAVECALLIALPLAFAVVAGLLNVWMISLAFCSVGLVSGGVVGYYLYVLFLHTIPSPVLTTGYTLSFCLSVLICAIAGAIALLKFKHSILMLATAAVGAVGVVVGLDLLMLGRIDRRFLYLLDARSASEHLSSPFVFGPIIGAALLAVGGFAFQRKQRQKRRVRDYMAPLISQ
jgi:hypothetical protein